MESVRENIEAENQADLQEAAEAYQLRLGNEGLETNVDRVDYANHGNIFFRIDTKSKHWKNNGEIDSSFEDNCSLLSAEFEIMFIW